MKRTNSFPLVGLAAAVLLLAGCDNKPRAHFKPPPLPPPTTESTIRRLTTPQEGVTPHGVAARSNFTGNVSPEGVASENPSDVTLERTPIRPRVAPELIPKSGLTIIDGVIEEHDWSGVVLVPKDLATALVFTSKVAVQYIEVHPLDNGSVRIWTRMLNRTGQEEEIQVGCAFRTSENPDSTTPQFYSIKLPKDFIDVFFVSPKENINGYTFLIRSAAEEAR